MSKLNQNISESKILHVQQVFEAFELLGFETRNKYKILNDDNEIMAYAAEQKTGVSGAILRHFLGHWRKFDVVIFDADREAYYKLHFPFRWFFKTLYVSDAHGRRIGHLQEKFAIFRKKFDAFDASNQSVAQINSSFFRFWTFDFLRGNRKICTVQKKWSGALNEFFTDKDNFAVKYSDPNLPLDHKVLMLATSVMIDIIYFENNKGSSALQLFD